MRTIEDLRALLRRIDGRGYKAYKDLSGAYALEEATLFVDHVQGDPFAAPSKLRLRVPAARAGFPKDLFDNRARRIALEDRLARAVQGALPRGPRRGSGRSGLVSIDAGGQEVLERTAVLVTSAFVEARIEAGLPADGRRVLGREAERILVEELPETGRRSLLWKSLDGDEVRRFVDAVENHAHLQNQLRERGLVAFVADGSLLPRASGASDLPMRDAVPFRSPERLRVELSLLRPEGGALVVAGLGIPEGVTLIVGGGYHGKTTLLEAIQRGVYPHVPGDGRERVVTREDAVKIRAENGRSVSEVDISSFIGELPLLRSTRRFSSDDASGSTSQAASIVEAIEAGSRFLMFDEDTSATNFLVRDARMQALVHRSDEPIVPLVDRVRELHERSGVATVLVMGGSGDYFEEADTVLCMRRFLPEDVTDEARRVAERLPTGRAHEAREELAPPKARRPRPGTIDASRGRREAKIDARGSNEIGFGSEVIDLRAIEQLVDPSQTRAVGFALHLASRRLLPGTLPEILDGLEAIFDREGLEALAFVRKGEHPGSFARPRRYEIAAALNRLRSVRMEQA